MPIMHKSSHIILHITTACNYNCSYCDVVKDGKNMDSQTINQVIYFLKKNAWNIRWVKFFGWEPLIRYDTLYSIVDATHTILGNHFEIVTNTTLLNKEIGRFLWNYFEKVFLSIDEEHGFLPERIFELITQCHLEEKVIFNMVVSPGKENIFLEMFFRLKEMGYKKYNILPVYFTEIWSPENLRNFAQIMRRVLDTQVEGVEFYGFQENTWYRTSLINESIFIDIDGRCYYSDFVSTRLGKKIQKSLLLSDTITEMQLDSIDTTLARNSLSEYESEIIQSIPGQYSLHKIMDYFSRYLNSIK